MANSKKRRKKTLIFGIIGLVFAGLTTAAIVKKRDVIITVQGRNGSEWLFLTHRSPGLRRAIADLNDLIAQ